MSTNEMVRKLNNARRDLMGRKDEKGNWFRAPNPSARDKVERWAFRLLHKGAINDSTRQKILADCGIG